MLPFGKAAEQMYVMVVEEAPRLLDNLRGVTMVDNIGIGGIVEGNWLQADFGPVDLRRHLIFTEATRKLHHTGARRCRIQ